MKTALQEAIEDIKEYRDGGNGDVDTCNAILLKLASMVHKEQDIIANAYLDGFVNSDATELKVSLIDYYNETFTEDTSNRARLLDEMTKRNQELGLYDETFKTNE